MVTHPGTNRVWRTATTLIEANVLPLSQTANQIYAVFCKQTLKTFAVPAVTFKDHSKSTVITLCDASRPIFYLSSTVNMCLSSAISETQQYTGLKSQIFI